MIHVNFCYYAKLTAFKIQWAKGEISLKEK